MLQRVLARVLRKGAMRGMEPAGPTRERFDAFLRAGIRKWARVVKESGARTD